jgi:stearoyl-CoA desaturase (delta-9 desaturase)
MKAGFEASSATAVAVKKKKKKHPQLRAVPAQDRWSKGLDWPVVVWIVVVHVGALAALLPMFFNWQAVALFVFMSWLTGSIGVCMGYHRQLTHGSFQTYKPIRWFLAFVGGLSGEGSALMWVANHRKHHLYSDKDGDPHSPRDGAWWAHMLWFMPTIDKDERDAHFQHYAPDMYRDPMMRFLDIMFLPMHLMTGILFYALGYYLGGDWQTGTSFVIWGLFLRLVYVFHVTWFVNSATHIWGYRNYETSDDSRNLWWVGLLAFGEGWHNNHHAFQRMAKQGHKWWEVDITYWCILGMEKLGLAWNVVKDPPQHGRPD